MSKGEVSEPKNKTEMKEINGYLFPTVPEGFYGYKIVHDAITGNTLLQVSDRVGDCIYIPLPKGTYSIVGLAKDLVGKSDYGELLIYLVENDYNLDTTLILKKIL